MARKPRNKSAGKFPPQLDVLVAGGGYVGLSVAAAIASGSADLSVGVVDPAPDAAIDRDERSSAIAAAASRMLAQLGVWHTLEEKAQPIREMIVTDSKVPDVIRPVFLTFDSEGREADAPFAHMLENRHLVKQLRERADALGVLRVAEDGVVDFEHETSGCLAALSSGATVRARLLVACDGVRSRLRDIAGIKCVNWSYDQKGIVTTVEHERPHNGRAEEHFLPAGPFAILPLKGNRSSLVWTESSREADRLIAADPLIFEHELEQRFGHKLGWVKPTGSVQAFPLGLRLARDFVKPGFALAGDAAHGIHPIAGQGLNLGFKDAAALAQVVVEAHRLGQDIGALDVLERYQQWRRFDTVRMGAVTDILNRLFSNNSDFLRALRDFGLGAVDRMPGLKRMFIGQAAGNSAREPNLLRGEAI